MTHYEVSDVIPMPRDKLFSLMSDYKNWPKFFPYHQAVRLIRKEGNDEYLEIDDKSMGKITEIHTAMPPDKINIQEFTPHWNGTFLNIFTSTPDGNTRLTVLADVTLKGYYKILAVFLPLMKGYARRRGKKLIHEEIKRAVRTTFAQ